MGTISSADLQRLAEFKMSLEGGADGDADADADASTSPAPSPAEDVEGVEGEDLTDELTEDEVADLFAAFDDGDWVSVDGYLDLAEKRHQAKAGGADRNRGGAEQLRRYWTTGPGGAKIAWGTDGDFTRCVKLVGEYMSPEKAKGYCANRHKEMTGQWPGQKAASARIEKKDSNVMEMERKVVPVVGQKVLDVNQGIVETIVSVTGHVDEVADNILPGAYLKTLATRTPKGVWSHDWEKPISKTLKIEELMPGDRRLPRKQRDGSPWPTKAGGLLVQTQFNLETQRGKEAFSDVKFFGEEQEWSIGYQVPQDGAKMNKGVREIKTIDLFEYSPVLFGAMPLAATTSVKTAQEAYRAVENALEAKKGSAANPARAKRPADDDDEPKTPTEVAAARSEREYERDAIGRFGSGGGKDDDDGGAAGPDKPKPKAGASMEHTVVEGDTLWDLAENLLGDGSRWKEIAEASGLGEDFDPTELPVGTVLTIPGAEGGDAEGDPASEPDDDDGVNSTDTATDDPEKVQAARVRERVRERVNERREDDDDAEGLTDEEREAIRKRTRARVNERITEREKGLYEALALDVKVGRVLSAANVRALEEARDAIAKVLEAHASRTAPVEADVAEKSVKAAERNYVRDGRGRFARVGSIVDLSGGDSGTGKIVAVNDDGTAKVEKEDGSTVDVDPSKITKAEDQSAATGPEAEAQAAPGVEADRDPAIGAVQPDEEPETQRRAELQAAEAALANVEARIALLDEFAAASAAALDSDDPEDHRAAAALAERAGMQAGAAMHTRRAGTPTMRTEDEGVDDDYLDARVADGTPLTAEDEATAAGGDEADEVLSAAEETQLVEAAQNAWGTDEAGNLRAALIEGRHADVAETLGELLENGSDAAFEDAGTSYDEIQSMLNRLNKEPDDDYLDARIADGTPLTADDEATVAETQAVDAFTEFWNGGGSAPPEVVDALPDDLRAAVEAHDESAMDGGPTGPELAEAVDALIEKYRGGTNVDAADNEPVEVDRSDVSADSATTAPTPSALPTSPATLEEAEQALDAAIADATADNPDVSADDIAHDMVLSIVDTIEDDAVAREFLRTQIGHIPGGYEERLGERDWIDGPDATNLPVVEPVESYADYMIEATGGFLAVDDGGTRVAEDFRDYVEPLGHLLDVDTAEGGWASGLPGDGFDTLFNRVGRSDREDEEPEGDDEYDFQPGDRYGDAVREVERLADEWEMDPEAIIEFRRDAHELGWSVEEQLRDILRGAPFEEQNENALRIISRLLDRHAGLAVNGNGDEGLGALANAIEEYLLAEPPEGSREKGMAKRVESKVRARVRTTSRASQPRRRAPRDEDVPEGKALIGMADLMQAARYRYE